MNGWSMAKYYYAIAWWRGCAQGHGHFNQELYERFLEIRYGITILQIKEEQKETFKIKI